MGALREVREETGRHARLGASLGATSYLKDGASKRVRYWSLAATSGSFTPGDEIDDLLWVPPDAALRLARCRDWPLIERFWAGSAYLSQPLVLVRPGHKASGMHAGSRRRALGGGRQAKALADLVKAFGIRQVVTTDVPRCVETVEPLVRDAWLSEFVLVPDRAARLRAAVDQVWSATRQGVPTAVCADRNMLASVVGDIAVASPELLPRIAGLPAGSMYVVHLTRPGPGRVVGSERISPAA